MVSKLSYHCPVCGTPLIYEGLCWRCKSEQSRQAVLAWTAEQVKEKQQGLLRNIKALGEMKQEESTDFWNLLSYRNVITPDIQRAALDADVFWPAEIYYHAPEDVRDGLIAGLMNTKSPDVASRLMMCLAMQGDDRALEILLELERSPRPWRKKLHADPSVYAQCGGWTFDKEGHRQELNFNVCYPMTRGTEETPSPVRIGRPRKDSCPYCGGKMVDILVLDGRDDRLRFLGIDGILTAVCCPNCICFMEEAGLNRFALDGGSEVIPTKLFDDDIENYIRAEDFAAMTQNHLVLGTEPVPLFYGAEFCDVNTIGGFANWVQDWNYTKCPDCGRAMKYLAQIQWDTVLEGAEGTLFIEFCSDCRIVSMQHQQT